MTDLSPDARQLLDLSRDTDDPSALDRARVRRALGASLAAGAVGMAPSIATASALAGTGTAAAVSVAKIATWVGIGLVAGTGVAGTLLLTTSNHAAPARSTAPAAVAPAPSVLPPASGPGTERGLVGPAVEDAPMPAPPARATTPPAAATKAASSPSSLGAETALLEAARAALGRGDAEGALALLETHERLYPAGALVEERLASKVFALCGLGRRADAARAARTLLESAPSTPLRARVLGSCAFRTE